MPAKDVYHEIVKRALEKESWIITDDPLVIQVDQKRSVYIDLGAETLVSAEKDGRKIAVEIKSFIGKAFTTEFYLALGQFITYQGILQEREPERELYLAVPKNIYKNQFDSSLVTLAVKNSKLKYVVYDIQQECVIAWLN